MCVPYCQTGLFVHGNSASICLSHCDIACCHFFVRLFVGNLLRCVSTLIGSLSPPWLRLSPFAARPKLKLLPHTVKDPVNTFVHTERNASIFGTGKPRESSLVNETKRMLSQSNKDSGQSTDWRKTSAANDSQYNINMIKPSFRYDSLSFQSLSLQFLA